jgi:hypothetical protein
VFWEPLEKVDMADVPGAAPCCHPAALQHRTMIRRGRALS